MTRKVGKGRITYVGVWMDDKGMDAAAQWMANVSGIKPAFGPLPQGVDVYPRYGKDKDVYILVSLRKDQTKVKLPSEMQDLLNWTSEDSVILGQYGIAVLARPHARVTIRPGRSGR